ncbi:MAG: hypothetical protein R3C26_15315 [Calditrichia bacterium]
MRFFFSMLIGFWGFVFAQSEATIMTYNILDYTGRTQAFDTVIDEIEPDLLVTRKWVRTGVNAFLNILNDNGTPYAAAPYFDGPDKDMALFYPHRRFRSGERYDTPRYFAAGYLPIPRAAHPFRRYADRFPCT